MACCITPTPTTAKCLSLNPSFRLSPRPSPSLSLSLSLWTSKRRTKSRGRISAAIPDPAFDPNSPFAKKLSDAIASNPEEALHQSRSDDRPPLLHMLDKYDIDKETRKKMIDDFIKHSPFYMRCRAARSSPPDLISTFFDQFVVCIDYPLVSLVSELVIAQVLYLQSKDPYHPIYLYINSTGTSREDGQKVAFESDAFAIYDILDFVFNEIRTVVIGQAYGLACLLAASGRKGRRYIFPNGLVRLEEPQLFASGQLSEVDVAIRTKEAIRDRDLTIKLFAKHTGHSLETIANAMRAGKTMWPKEAIEFGVIDKLVLRDSKDTAMKEFTKPEGYAKKASNQREGPYGEGERGLG